MGIMDVQDLVVYVIIGCTLFFVVRYVYRQVRGKGKGCGCGSCPREDKGCGCGDTQK